MVVLILKRNSSADPTRQASNRKNAHRKIRKQLRIAFNAVETRFKQVPRKTIVTNSVEYEDDDEFYEEIVILIILALLIDNGRYLDDNIAAAILSGSVSQMNAMEVQLRRLDPRNTINLRELLSNQEFLNQLAIQQQLMRDKIVDLSSHLSNQVSETIRRGINSQLSQAEILKKIRERFSVVDSFSLQSVTTVINESLNNAKLEAILAANKHLLQFGFGAKVIHISALLPNRTRKTHAARHNKTFTFQAQMRWWNTGSNRINCLCSVKPKIIKLTKKTN